MKKYSIRTTPLEAQWLQSQAKSQGIFITDYIRHLIAEEMLKSHFVPYLKIRSPNKPLNLPQQKEISYSIMAYKLLEKLVLNHAEGLQMRETAYAETLALLTQLKMHPHAARRYAFTVVLDPRQATWISQEARKLNKSASYVVHRILLLAFEQSMGDALPLNLDFAQKEGVKFMVLCYKLLERYFSKIHDSGSEIIKEAEGEALELYAKLYSGIDSKKQI